MRPQPVLPEVEVEPLGPDSLLWQYFGDRRLNLLALWAGSMQNMYPQLGAGVEEHSRFFDERWQRLWRSTYPIAGCVYDGQRSVQTAHEVRDYHRTIKGVDKQGRPYSALNPDTFFWAHATFLMLPVLVCEHFGTPLSREQKEQLYVEGVHWWRLYGLSMRPVPPDWDSFVAYWDDVCANELEDNKATRDVLDIRYIAKPPALPWLPDTVWSMLRLPIFHGFTWLTVGLYPEPVRAKLGFGWRRRDEAAFRLVGRAVATGWRLVPHDRRYHARARSARQRERGEIPADAPLVHTRARNLPPLSERGKPTHYCPAR
jgi:uncharacterized protein (DUF2236 family)